MQLCNSEDAAHESPNISDVRRLFDKCEFVGSAGAVGVSVNIEGAQAYLRWLQEYDRWSCWFLAFALLRVRI